MSTGEGACSAGAGLEEAWLATNFCVELIPVSVDRPRSVRAVGTSSMLVLERGKSRVVLLKDTNDDGLADTKTTVVSASVGLNHGMATNGGFLYASSESTVYRWPISSSFQAGSRQTVISQMSTGGHVTRTLAFDKTGRLYVSIGSLNNIDSNSFRARIRRFTIKNATLPISFSNGEVFADGLRNEVGLAFDRFGVLWGVENGADRLTRNDLGGDIHNGNPGEELNKFREVDKGKHWGYPFCWSEFSLPAGVGMGVGSVWAWPTTMNTITDAQCRTNYMPSALSMQAHSAPLGITFYAWKAARPSGCKGAFPKYMNGYAFISSHGSWNSDIPVGYKVSYVKMNAGGNVPNGTVAEDLLKHMPPNAKWPDGFRPVDVSFDTCGRLIVTSDGSDGSGMKVVRISYNANTNQCFSGEMTVELEDKSTIPLRNVKVGDKVKVDEGKFEPIYGFGHSDPNTSGEYIQLKLSNGRNLVISGDHLVFVGNHKSTPASTLRVGDEVVASNHVGPVKVEAIHTVTRKGAFSPFTYSGTIVVNGVKSSNYISLQNDAAYLTIGSIQTPFSHHWLSQSVVLPFRVLGSDTILSAWVFWLYGTGRWLLNQHASVTSVAMIPLVALLGAVSLLETLWLHPHGALVVMMLFAAYMVAKRKNSLMTKKRIIV